MMFSYLRAESAIVTADAPVADTADTVPLSQDDADEENVVDMGQDDGPTADEVQLS